MNVDFVQLWFALRVGAACVAVFLIVVVGTIMSVLALHDRVRGHLHERARRRRLGHR
jgi:uncharacterized integral membrane protein